MPSPAVRFIQTDQWGPTSAPSIGIRVIATFPVLLVSDNAPGACPHALKPGAFTNPAVSQPDLGYVKYDADSDSLIFSVQQCPPCFTAVQLESDEPPSITQEPHFTQYNMQLPQMLTLAFYDTVQTQPSVPGTYYVAWFNDSLMPAIRPAYWDGTHFLYNNDVIDPQPSVWASVVIGSKTQEAIWN